MNLIQRQEAPDKWYRCIDACFKLDTGPEVSAISDDTYRAVGEPRLREANKLIYGSARHKLHVLGQIEENVSHDDISAVQTIYVIKSLKANLLGLPGITALQILQRVNSLGSDKTTILQQNPTVFEGLGTLGDEYCIQLREEPHPIPSTLHGMSPCPYEGKYEMSSTRWRTWESSRR